MSEDQYSNLTPRELVGRLLLEHTLKLVDGIFTHARLSEDKKQKLQEEYKEYYAAECRKINKSFDNPEKDIAPKLKFINRQWDLFQPVFNSKYVSRSYLSLLIEFRNQWAHNDPLSFDEVVYFAETINRLAHIVQDYPVIQDVQGIIEYIESQKSKTDVEEYLKNNPDMMKANNMDIFQESLNESDGFPTINPNDVNSINNSDVDLLGRLFPDRLDRQAFDALLYDEYGIFFEDHTDLYETLYPTFFEGLSELDLQVLEDDYPLLVKQIKNDQGKETLEREKPNQTDLSEDILDYDNDQDFEKVEVEDDDVMIGLNGRSTCTNGKYPDTLYFSADTPGFALGSHKLLLIILNRKILEEFVNNQLNDREYLDSYKGNPVICIPSVQNAEIRMGKNRARIILDQYDNIVKWLYNNNKLTAIITYIQSQKDD